jgi:quinol monooxygenase YgiN
MLRRDFMGLGLAAVSTLAGSAAAANSHNSRIAVMAELIFPPDKEEAAAEALSELTRATRLEAGCRHYAVGRDTGNPGHFHLSELWDDLPALAAHFKTPHMARFSAAARQLGYSAGEMMQIEITRVGKLNPRELLAMTDNQ